MQGIKQQIDDNFEKFKHDGYLRIIIQDLQSLIREACLFQEQLFLDKHEHVFDPKTRHGYLDRRTCETNPNTQEMICTASSKELKLYEVMQEIADYIIKKIYVVRKYNSTHVHWQYIYKENDEQFPADFHMHQDFSLIGITWANMPGLIDNLGNSLHWDDSIIVLFGKQSSDFANPIWHGVVKNKKDDVRRAGAVFVDLQDSLEDEFAKIHLK